MSAASFRRAAGVLAALITIGAAPILTPGHAGAAVADSSVAITDSSGDAVRGNEDAGEPKADIVAASARHQNEFVSFTMKLAKGDDLTTESANDYVRWAINTQGDSSPDFVVQLKRGDGFGEVGVFVPGEVGIPCPNAIGSFDGVNGLYLVSVPARCIGSPASFTWAAERSMTSAGAGVALSPAKDTAPDEGMAKEVVPATVVGYWAIGADGKVYPFGDAAKFGEPSSPANLVVDIEAAPHGGGYWALDSKGIVNAFGPVFYGSLAPSDLRPGEKAVSMSATKTGAGYWVFTSLGRMFAFGDANKNIGDVSTLKLNGEIVDSTVTPSGNGYYLTAADGGVFALGDAKFEGSMGNVKLNKPVVAIVPDPDGEGYWQVATDGGVFSFKALFHGSMGDVVLNKPMRGMVPYGSGYLMVAEDGGVFNFSDKPFSGSTGANPPAVPMVSITVLQ